QLDEIDHAAHSEIERLKAAAGGGRGVGAALRLTALVSEIAAVIAKARSAAEALSASIAGEISIQVAQMGAYQAPATPPANSSGSDLDDLRRLNFAGGNPREGMPLGLGPVPLAPE